MTRIGTALQNRHGTRGGAPLARNLVATHAKGDGNVQRVLDAAARQAHHRVAPPEELRGDAVPARPGAEALLSKLQPCAHNTPTDRASTYNEYTAC